MFKRLSIVLLLVLVACVSIAQAQQPTEEEQVATVIMWYTADGMPHDIFIVDGMHWTQPSEQIIVISKSRNWDFPRKILVGGMFYVQNYNYYDVFKRADDPILRDYFAGLVQSFKKMVAQRLTPKKKDY